MTCYLGLPCEFTYADASASFSLASGPCEASRKQLTYGGAFSSVTTATGTTHSFGTSTEPNGITGAQLSLCWGRGSTGHLVQAGTLVMKGPTSGTQSFSCVAGSVCTLEVAGTFGYVGTANVRSGQLCSDSVVATANTLTATETSSLIPFSGIGIAVPNSLLAVCWSSLFTGATFVPVGLVTLYGPSALQQPLACTIGAACSVDLRVTFPPSLSPPNQWLLLIEAPSGDPDPCSISAGVEVIATSLPGIRDHDVTSFTFDYFAKAPSSGQTQTVCWRTTERPVPVGEWTFEGPESLVDTACSLGQACSVSVPNAVAGGIFFLIETDRECSMSSARMVLPVIRGGSNPASLTTASTFSFGTAWGVSGTSYSLCYAMTNSLRRAVLLGAVTYTNPFSVTTGGTGCVVSEDCTLTVSTGSIAVVNPKLYLATDADCSDAVTSQISPSAGGTTFTFAPLVATHTGALIVCYTDGAAVNVGTVGVKGLGLGLGQCVRGASACVLPASVSPTTTSASLFISPSTTACTSMQPVVAYSGATSVTWTIAGSNIEASSGIARTPGVSQVGLCYTSDSSNAAQAAVVVGTIEFIGPTESNAPICSNGAVCTVTLSGSFLTTGGEITLVDKVALTITPYVNPCAGASSSLVAASAETGTDFPLSADSFATSAAVFSLNPIAALAKDYTVCWREGGGGVFVPAGSLSVIGAAAVTTSSCPLSAILDCVLEVTVQGVASVLINAQAVLTTELCGTGAEFALITRPDPQLALIHPIDVTSTSTNLVFNFGRISAVTGRVTLCWSPVMAPAITDVLVDLGPITFHPPICDLGVTALNPTVADSSCLVTYSEQARIRSLSLAQYAVTTKANALLSLVLPDSGDRSSILEFAIQENADIATIALLLTYPVEVKLAALQAAVSLGRDDVCRLLVPRISAADYEPVLPAMVAAQLYACLAVATERDVDVSSSLHRTIDSNDDVAFAILMQQCCPVEPCLQADDGSQTVRERVLMRTGFGADQPDPFLVVMRDAVAACGQA